MSRLRFRSAVSPCVLALLLVSIADSQESTVGGIVGEVRDTSGASVAGARISVINSATGSTRDSLSDAEGNFVIPNLPPASYRLRVEKEGFQAAVVDSLELRVGLVLRQAITLTVGAVTEQVNVAAEAPLIQTESGAVTQVIDEKRIVELPLNGRNLVQLAVLSAGVSPRTIQRGTTQYGERNLYVTVDGGRDSSTNYVVDGVYVRSLRFNNLSLQPSVETIQEFNILRNSFSAEYGQGQSVVTAVTKSGSNEFHGALFHFLRNDKLDARNFFAAQRPPYRRNQFGGTAGGAILKNRWFVFGGYEGLQTRQGRPFRARVPETAQLAGNLSSFTTPILDPFSGPPGARTPFPGNIIPSQRISRFANVLSPTIPAPNVQGANNYLVTKTFSDEWNNVTFRSDQILSSRHTLFQRYIWYDAAQLSPAAFTSTSFPQSAQNLSLGDTFIFSSTVVNDLRLGYNRANHLWQPLSLEGKNWIEMLGLRNLAGGTDPINYGRPGWTIAGYTGQGEVTPTQGAIENIYSISDTVSKVFNKHSIRTGIQAQHRRFFHITEVPPRGNFSFDGKFSGNAIADYLLGTCASCGGALGSSRSNYRSNTLSLFVNDDWRATQRLTINLGLRYEYLGWWREQINQEGSFVPDVGKIGYHKVPDVIPAPLVPLIVNQDDVFPAGIIHPDKNNWGPRVGIAYRLSDRLVIRSGFGTYFDNVNLNELQFTRLVAPFYANRTIVPDLGAPVIADNLFPGLAETTSFPAPFSVSSDNRTPYTMQWNFNVQYNLARDMVIEVAYTGSGSRRLTKRWNQNQAAFGTTPIATRTPYPNFDPAILTSTNDANASFNGISVRLEKRYGNGLYVLGNYQFSKNIDNNSGETEANDTAFRQNKRLDRGRSRYDQRHRSTMSGGWELPFGRGRKYLSDSRAADLVIGGWQVQGIVTLLSGPPFTPTGPSVCDCGSFIPQRVNVLREDYGRLEERTPNRWFDATAYALPARGFQGNAGRNVLEGPGYQTVDLSFAKIFSLTERVRLQFRGELFNVLNRANFANPDNNIASGSVGVIAAANDGRSIQFGLKLIW
jgi:hypothetical protein